VGPAVHADFGRSCPLRQHGIGSRWQVDETYVKVAGCWRYVYRAVDEYGQVIDVYVSPRRDSGGHCCFGEEYASITVDCDSSAWIHRGNSLVRVGRDARMPF
jgi:hypothetical protein